MNKRVFFLTVLFCAQLSAKKVVRESRTHLQESIACSAVDILKSSHEVLKNCAQQVRILKRRDSGLADIIEQIAVLDDLMITLTQELVEESNDRWAIASRQVLHDVHEKLEEVNVQMCDKKSDVSWWRGVCQEINAVLPPSQKHDKEP